MKLFGVLMLLFLIFTFVGIDEQTEAEIDQWPTTSGKIITSTYHLDYTTDDGDRDYHYDITITYQYVVDGQQYQSGLVSYSNNPNKVETEEEAIKITNEWYKGRNVTVHYNSEFPSHSTIEYDENAGYSTIEIFNIVWLFSIVIVLLIRDRISHELKYIRKGRKNSIIPVRDEKTLEKYGFQSDGFKKFFKYIESDPDGDYWLRKFPVSLIISLFVPLVFVGQIGYNLIIPLHSELLFYIFNLDTIFELIFIISTIIGFVGAWFIYKYNSDFDKENGILESFHNYLTIWVSLMVDGLIFYIFIALFYSIALLVSLLINSTIYLFNSSLVGWSLIESTIYLSIFLTIFMLILFPRLERYRRLGKYKIEIDDKEL